MQPRTRNDRLASTVEGRGEQFLRPGGAAQSLHHEERHAQGIVVIFEQERFGQGYPRDSVEGPVHGVFGAPVALEE
jgi:hypothetical protein